MSIFSRLSIHAVLFCISIGLSGGLAVAQNTLDPLNQHTFRSPIDAFGMLSVERARGLGHLKFNLSLLIDSERDSLQFNYGGRTYPALKQITTGQFNVALGLWGRVTLGVSQSLHIIKQDLDGPNGLPDESDDGLGDTRFMIKGIIFDSDLSPVGLALQLDARFSFGDPLTNLSAGSDPVLVPWLIVDSAWQYVALSLNLGYALSQTGTLAPVGPSGVVEDPLNFGPEALYRAGVSVFYVPRFFHHIFEVVGGQAIGADVTRPSRLEVISGLKLLFNRGSYLAIGGGRGLLDGYAQPAWRAFINIAFHPKASDSDGDGIFDEKDGCPSEAEDLDGFEDQDGCPDPDNDNDGFTDLYDQCPNEPEDINQYEDDDGCPDGQRDLDKDGIADPIDDCPQDPEDRDGFSDGDGCPDPDNDRDGNPDQTDRCPNEPEDIDGFEDEDGCPDPDNDRDGIPDVRDRCPATPEDLDGDADDDGCPETSSQLVTDQGERLQIKGKVFFDLDKATIKEESYLLLLEIARFINERPQITLIEIQGHTDHQGSRSYNIELSQRRAQAVLRFMVNEGSVNPERLLSKGYGPDQPLEPGRDAKAAAKNRRVEFVVLKRDQ